MINLLPPNTRKSLLYARKNTKLVHWVFALTIALLVTILIVLVGIVYLRQSTQSYQNRVDTAQKELEQQDLTATQNQVEAYSNNIKLATDVLQQEILFSKVLQDLGGALPADTRLKELQIENIQGGLTLIAQTSNITSATQIQVNLEDPENKLFEKADIENIVCGLSKSPEDIYDCEATIRALFLENNPFSYTFIERKQPANGGQQ